MITEYSYHHLRLKHNTHRFTSTAGSSAAAMFSRPSLSVRRL